MKLVMWSTQDCSAVWLLLMYSRSCLVMRHFIFPFWQWHNCALLTWPVNVPVNVLHRDVKIKACHLCWLRTDNAFVEFFELWIISSQPSFRGDLNAWLKYESCQLGNTAGISSEFLLFKKKKKNRISNKLCIFFRKCYNRHSSKSSRTTLKMNIASSTNRNCFWQLQMIVFTHSDRCRI